jgi:plastocyanin domain-containing protein
MRLAVVSCVLLLTAIAAADPQRADISITRHGFEPDHVAVKKGEEITLAFTRKTDSTCAKKVVVELGDGKSVTKDLPLDTTVEVRATFAKTGELRYACGMDMLHGTLTVQ